MASHGPFLWSCYSWPIQDLEICNHDCVSKHVNIRNSLLFHQEAYRDALELKCGHLSSHTLKIETPEFDCGHFGAQSKSEL